MTTPTIMSARDHTHSHPVEVLDDAPGEVPLQFDGHLDQLVEVVGTDSKHSQYPWKRPEKNNIKVGAIWSRILTHLLCEL